VWPYLSPVCLHGVHRYNLNFKAACTISFITLRFQVAEHVRFYICFGFKLFIIYWKKRLYFMFALFISVELWLYRQLIFNLEEPCILYIPLPSKRCILYIFSTNKSTEHFKHAAHSPFFSSKCRLFHNATFFGFCVIYILDTGVLKFKCKI
jgi:hypothetical protein